MSSGPTPVPVTRPPRSLRVLGSVGDRQGDVDRLDGRRIAAEPADHRRVVVLHEPEPRVLGLAGSAGKVVVAQRVLVADAGGLADLLEHLRREDLRAEDGGHALSLDLLDESRNLSRAGIGEVLRLDGADDLPAEVLGEVGVGIVVGHELERAVRHRLLVGADRRRQFVGLGLERGVVVGEVRGTVRVERRELVADQGGVLDGVGRIGPQVRVRLALLRGEGEVEDVVRLGQDLGAELDDRRVLRLVRLGELEGGVLELEAVDHDQVSRAEELGDPRLGLEGVAVRPLGHDPLDLHPVSPDARGDRRDRRDGGGD